MEKQVYNPFLPSYEYIPDGEPHIFGDRVYLYGSHDKFNGTDYCMNPYVCWSAPVDDLSSWKYEGIILDKGMDPLDPEGNKLYYAPDVAQGKDGRYYLYYSIEGSCCISVAVCDTPAGKYKFHGHVQDQDRHVLGSAEGDAYQFDPGIFVDDDGRCYLYSGGNSLFADEDQGRKRVGAMVMELEDDMMTVKSMPEIITSNKEKAFEENQYFEAPSVRKVNGLYYFIYSSFPNVHNLCYATSPYPDRDFTYRGVIISNADIFTDNKERNKAMSYCGNNHGSFIQIKGQWYIFYHRHSNRDGYNRQACAEKIFFLEDGTIPQVELTSCGLNDGDLAEVGTYEARIACNMASKEGVPLLVLTYDENHPYFTQEGEDREENGNQYIANFQDGATAGYKYFQFAEGNRFRIKIRGEATGKILVTHHLGGEVCASVIITPSEEWQNYETAFSPEKGRQPVFITFQGTGVIDILEFEFKKI
ncbi:MULTISPECIES: family 43 glycosylhydrolase [unclassified Paenibacillus]|uniref:family 43 glycosylhydrolase n=1 Tax=unclassified Paenibacillus TaxID=185978 RepID=UPI000CFC7994|nr:MULTISPECIES: family 43 glycosylhydrolase [unclassified Paenibacillus]PRA09468.1 hypothetical protein CQ043_05725 [Paenibacillus sp. MYb63]PRA46222.1 hypothetical protein CQ061_19740 [Paenibacillus sp. MYb67]QZN73694.1 family 43 glycosylhydrolase [Paenibacillus sp. DR312]